MNNDDRIVSSAEVDIPPAFLDVERLQVLCLVQTDNGIASDADRDRICDAVVRTAGEGVKIPVSTIAIGNPQVVAQGCLTVLVHASMTGTGQVVLTMRPYRPVVTGSEVLFGSRPRIAEMSDSPALEQAIAASLDEILPWRSRGFTSRRIG